MKHTCLIALSFLVAPLFSHAEQSGLCEDMASFSCAPGKYDDGTGSVQIGRDYRKKAAESFKRNEGAARTTFAQLLEDPKSSYFRKLTIAALGLQNSPDCVSSDSDAQKRCNSNAVDGLVVISAKKLGVGETSDTSSWDLENLSYVANNASFKKALREMQLKMGDQTEIDNNYKKVEEKMFPQIQKLLVKKISSLPIDEKNKALMIEKINGISLSGTDCTEDTTKLHEQFIPNASYYGSSQEVRICKGYLGSDFSEFKLARTIGHELMHAVDPCIIGRGLEGVKFNYSPKSDREKKESEYPVKGLIECLRSEKSVSARYQNGAGMTTPQGGFGGGGNVRGYEQGAGNGMMPPPNMPMPNAYYPPNGYGGAIVYGAPSGYYNGAYGNINAAVAGNAPPQQQPAPPEEYSFCKGDQIGESVADWFGDDILVDYISSNYPNLTQTQWQHGVSNVFRQVCDPGSTKDTMAFDEHPDTKDRINRLLLVNPQVRQKLGCQKPHTKFIYCDAANPDAMAKAVGPRKSSEGPQTPVAPPVSVPNYNGGTR